MQQLEVNKYFVILRRYINLTKNVVMSWKNFNSPPSLPYNGNPFNNISNLENISNIANLNENERTDITKIFNKDENSNLNDWQDVNRGRNRRRDNYKIIYNFSIFDERGRELLLRWLDGSGKELSVENGEWGEYMRSNKNLRDQIWLILSNDAYERETGGYFNYKGHAEIENGYYTGYEMLHGTNSTTGDFQIHGFVIKIDELTYKYSVSLEWHDIIDPNNQYGSDSISPETLESLYSPRDFKIDIKWNDTFIINK